MQKQTFDSSNKAPGFEYYLEKLQGSSQAAPKEEKERQTTLASRNLLVILEKEGPTQVSDLLKKLDMNNEADIPIFVESLHQLQQAGLVEYDGEHEVVLLTSTGGKVVKLLSEVG